MVGVYHHYVVLDEGLYSFLCAIKKEETDQEPGSIYVYV